VERGKVLFPLNGLWHPFNELSAGFESVLVMGVDTMSGAMGTVSDLSNHSPLRSQ
jgi:hypothetical protein